MKLPQTFGDKKNLINVVIETPRGSRNKYDYDEEHDYFKLGKTLPDGTAFPLDFGFIPQTKAPDGDPIDALVIMEQPTYPGCVIACRCIGVIEAEQKEKGESKYRNDRILVVSNESLIYSNLNSVKDVNHTLLEDVGHFFKYYNQMVGKKFKLLGVKDKNIAMKLIKKTMTNNNS